MDDEVVSEIGMALSISVKQLDRSTKLLSDSAPKLTEMAKGQLVVHSQVAGHSHQVVQLKSSP